jgi:predicted MPP superfamily phosphohydrolase
VNLPVIGSPIAHLRHRHRYPRYVYGEYGLGQRRMIVSGGLGTPYAPVRVLRPPEVVVVKLGGDATAV